MRINTVATKTDERPGRRPSGLCAQREGPLHGPLLVREQLTNPTINSFNLNYNPYNVFQAWNFVTGYTRTIVGKLLVNDARLGVNYDRIGQNQISSNFPGSAGTLFRIPGLTQSFLPALSFSGGYVSNFGNKVSATNNNDTSIQYADALSWVHGKHNTRFGFQGWRIRTNGLFNGNNGQAGSFSFSALYSGSPESNFLLGLPTSVGAGSHGSDWGQRNNIFAGFIQDDWKLTTKLTANLGLRYETHTPFVEAHDRASELGSADGQPRVTRIKTATAAHSTTRTTVTATTSLASASLTR